MVFKTLIPSVTLDNISEFLEDILDYQNRFKKFATPFEDLYQHPLCIDNVDRIYDASIEDEDVTYDTLYNISFRFIGIDGVEYYTYAHMRINYGYDIDEEFIRGTMFITKRVRLFFMTTMPSIQETDEIHGFLLEDGIDLCFDEQHLPTVAHISRVNYALQII